jgi:hypothetical protein
MAMTIIAASGSVRAGKARDSTVSFSEDRLSVGWPAGARLLISSRIASESFRTISVEAGTLLADGGRLTALYVARGTKTAKKRISSAQPM